MAITNNPARRSILGGALAASAVALPAAPAADPLSEPLLQLWRTVRAAWAAEVASDDDGNGPTVAAYRAAHIAFRKAEPTTTLGLFLTLLDSDDGDNFADEHPEAVEAMIAQLQAANVPLAGLPPGRKGGAA